MKEGLHLGPKPPRTRALVGLVVVALLAAGAIQAVQYVQMRRELRELEAETAALGTSSPPGASQVEPGLGALVPRLRAVLASGALEALPPTELLRMVAENLPVGVDLDGLSMKVAPPGLSMTLEAVARTSEDVTEMQRRLAEEPVVAATSVLDERRAADGRLEVRLSVELQGRGR